jgi:hypothetical protein
MALLINKTPEPIDAKASGKQSEAMQNRLSAQRCGLPVSLCPLQLTAKEGRPRIPPSVNGNASAGRSLRAQEMRRT